MNKKIFPAALVALALILVPAAAGAQEHQTRNREGDVNYDIFKKTEDTVKIYFVGHASLFLEFNDLIVHIDPIGNQGNYGKYPKADIILITHSHSDHLDRSAIRLIEKPGTVTILDRGSRQKLGSGKTIANGENMTVDGIGIDAVPAYNTTNGHTQFHPKGRDNGYVLTLGSIRLYIAGDTEDIPEMADLENIDIAFLPMNQPYTMTPEQVSNAALSFMPGILYPYHFSNTDTSILSTLLEDSGIEVRIRDMK